jgi:hypothetical protein
MPINTGKHYPAGIENPRVGGSIPPQATSYSRGLAAVKPLTLSCFWACSIGVNRVLRRPAGIAGPGCLTVTYQIIASAISRTMTDMFQLASASPAKKALLEILVLTTQRVRGSPCGSCIGCGSAMSPTALRKSPWSSVEVV